MPFKINISEKTGKTFHLESEAESLNGKELNNKIDGKDISPDLEGYEFEIMGTSDKSGFTSRSDVEGIGLKKVLLSYEKAMKKRPRKEGKKKLSNKTPGGLRLRKTVRGKIISPDISQINLKVIKEGSKKLSEVFPDQNKAPEPVVKEEVVKPEEKTPEKVEEKKEEKPSEEKEVKKDIEKPKEKKE
jgi:small subunit ribosomal protein S6e